MSATEVEVTARLLVLLRLCRDKGVLFRPCYLQAIKRFNREVREKAIADVLADY